MPIYSHQESTLVVLRDWSIRKTCNGNLRFVGFDTAKFDGRVSTPIISFDSYERIGTTASGSKYQLVGRAGRNWDAEYVWNKVCELLDIQLWTDVTQELVLDFREILSASERDKA